MSMNPFDFFAGSQVCLQNWGLNSKNTYEYQVQISRDSEGYTSAKLIPQIMQTTTRLVLWFDRRHDLTSLGVEHWRQPANDKKSGAMWCKAGGDLGEAKILQDLTIELLLNTYYLLKATSLLSDDNNSQAEWPYIVRLNKIFGYLLSPKGQKLLHNHQNMTVLPLKGRCRKFFDDLNAV